MRKSELIDIYILEILGHRASVEKKMMQQDIIKWLEEDYGIRVSRNTLSSYLNELREKKYIAGSRGVYRINQFSDQELRLLIDSVLFGQHIPVKDAAVLIDKLKRMSELSLRDRIKNVYYLEGINRTTNTRLYEMIDIIDKAIQTKRQNVKERIEDGANEKAVLRFPITALSFASISIFPG